MRISDVVLLYEIKRFAGANHEIENLLHFQQLLQTVTHLYFRDQSKDLTTTEQMHLFCERLAQCNALTSINLSANQFSCWDDILSILSSLPNLRIVNIRGSTISAEQVKSKCTNPDLEVIDDHSNPLHIPNPLFKIYGPWTEYEYKEMLLVGTIAKIEYPDTNINKFSRKRFLDLHLPLSVSFTSHNKPVVLIKTISKSADIVAYNDSEKDSKKVGLGLCFSDETTESLETVLIKKKPTNPLKNDELYRRELFELRKTQDAQGIKRYLKLYIIQQPLHGHTLSTLLEQYFFTNSVPTQEVRIKLALASMLSVLGSVHARGKVNLDLKPNNFILLNNLPINNIVVEGIDLESVQDCHPNEIFHLPNVFSTPGYRPPELFPKSKPKSYPIGRITDAFAMGITLQQLLVCEPYIHNGELLIEADMSEDSFYNDLMQFYANRLKEIFGDEVSQQIAGLLDHDFNIRSSLDSVFEFFINRYPDEAKVVMDSRFKYEIEHIRKILRKYPTIENFLHEIFFTQQEADWVIKVFRAFNGDAVPDLYFSDIIRIQILVQICQIIALCKGIITENLRNFCEGLLKSLIMANDINTSSSITYYEELEITNKLLYICIDDLYNGAIKLRDIIRQKQFVENEDIIFSSLGILHNQINSLMLSETSLQDILVFAINELDKISNTLIEDDNNHDIRKAISDAIINMHEFLERLGEPSNQNIPPPQNPLLFSAPRALIKDVSRFFSMQEIPHALRTGIMNDANDSAKLGKFLPFFESNNTIKTDLLLAGAKSLNVLIEQEDLEGVRERLLLGDNPCDPFRGSFTPLDSAYILLQRPLGKEIFALVLEYVQPEDLTRIIPYVQAALVPTINEPFDSSSLAIMLRVIAQNQHLFEEYLRTQLLAFFKNNQRQHILFFAEHGINILLDLQPDPTPSIFYYTFTKCFSSPDPYQYFNQCKNNIITLAMQNKHYAQVIELLPHIERTEANSMQLGFHLVVAAHENKRDLVFELLRSGADLSCRYPLGKYAGYSVADFALLYRYNHEFDQILQEPGQNRHMEQASLTRPSVHVA